MWIEQLPNGKYKYVERYTDPLTGKDKRVSLTHTKNNNIVKKEMQRLLQEKITFKTQTSQSTSKKTFRLISEEWLQLHTKNLKPNSIQSITARVNLLNEAFGDHAFSKLNAAMFNKYFLDCIQQTKLGYATVCMRKATLINIIKHALKFHGIDKTFIIPLLDVPKENKSSANDWKYLEREELQAVVQYLNDNKREEYARMVLLQTQTGMRYGEMIALDYTRHIDFDNNAIFIERTFVTADKSFGTPKTGKPRTVYFNEATKKLLKTQIAHAKAKKIRSNLARNNHLLFISREGKPISAVSFNTALRHTPVTNKKVTSHIFRHTFITMAVEKGIDKHLIAQQVGHTDTKMIDRVYAHFTQNMAEQQKRAMLDFNII